MTSRVVFLDRDGVINAEGGYVDRPENLYPLPGSLEAIASLGRAGWTSIVYTNQAGVGRGYMSEESLLAVHNHLHNVVRDSGGRLAAIYACVHAPDAECDCRKPTPGLLFQAAKEHGIDLRASYAVGDSPRDICAGHSAGCRTVLVLTGHTAAYDAALFPDPQPDYVFPTLLAFTDWLLSQSGRN